MRFATNAVGQGDTGLVVKQVLSITRQLRDALDPFVPLVRDLKKKQFVTNQSLRKIEDSKSTKRHVMQSHSSCSSCKKVSTPRLTLSCDPVFSLDVVLYAITVRSAEYGSDPRALQEMVRRTLASASSAQAGPNSADDDD